MSFLEFLTRLYIFICSAGLFSFIIYLQIKEPTMKTIIKELEKKWDHSAHDAAPFINFLFTPIFYIFGLTFLIYIVVIGPIYGMFFSLGIEPSFSDETMLETVITFSVFFMLVCYSKIDVSKKVYTGIPPQDFNNLSFESSKKNTKYLVQIDDKTSNNDQEVRQLINFIKKEIK